MNELTLGQAVQRARADARLTLREVGRRAKLSAAYLSDLERGRRGASPQTVEAIAKAVGCSEGWLQSYATRFIAGTHIERLERLGYRVTISAKKTGKAAV